MVTTIVLTVEDFRQDFPEFSDENVYADETLQGFINQAQCYIHNVNYGVLQGNCRKLAMELMVAHLQTLQTRMLSGGNATGQVGSTSIDSVSVSLIAPPNKTQFDYWLGLTPYGQRYLMLLMAHAPAGLYFGGSFQRVLR